MHMGIINRLLLFLYTISFALLSLGLIVVCLQIVPAQYIWNDFLYLSGRWETGAVAFVVFLWSIHLLSMSFVSAKKVSYDKEAILVHGSMGDVRVSIAAIRNMVDKVTRRVSGVRDVKVQVTAERSKTKEDLPEEASVRIKIRIVIGQESNVSKISDAIQDTVQSHLQEFIGLKNFSVNISVADISNAAIEKQRVV
jgi:uncharacterized alkaline shock family protein YloU